KSWFDRKRMFSESVQQYQEQLEKLTENRSAISQSIKSQLSNTVLRNVQEGVSPEYYSEDIKKLRARLTARREELQLEVNHYRLQMKLGEFVTQLNNGEPCMLCGSTHHPNILQVDDVQIVLNQTLKEIEGIKEDDKE